MTKKSGINQYWLGIKLGINLLSSALSIRNLFSIALSLTLTVPYKTNFMFGGYLIHFLRPLLPSLIPPLLPTSLIKLNGMVTIMSLSEKSNAPSPHLEEIIGIPPFFPFSHLYVVAKRISDSFASQGRNDHRKSRLLSAMMPNLLSRASQIFLIFLSFHKRMSHLRFQFFEQMALYYLGEWLKSFSVVIE